MPGAGAFVAGGAAHCPSMTIWPCWQSTLFGWAPAPGAQIAANVANAAASSGTDRFAYVPMARSFLSDVMAQEYERLVSFAFYFCALYR